VRVTGSVRFSYLSASLVHMALDGVNICDHDLVGLADFKNSFHSGVLCDSPWFGGGRLSG